MLQRKPTIANRPLKTSKWFHPEGATFELFLLETKAAPQLCRNTLSKIYLYREREMVYATYYYACIYIKIYRMISTLRKLALLSLFKHVSNSILCGIVRNRISQMQQELQEVRSFMKETLGILKQMQQANVEKNDTG